MLWPHSYRTHHTKRMACLLCGIVWLYVHVIILPGFIKDAMWYRLPLGMYPCFLNSNAQWTWALGIQILPFDSTIVVMLVGYAIIWYKQKNSNRTIHPAPADGAQGEFRSGAVRRSSTRNAFDMSAVNHRSKGLNKRFNGFTILSVMTISVTICWVPLLSYYTTILWIG